MARLCVVTLLLCSLALSASAARLLQQADANVTAASPAPAAEAAAPTPAPTTTSGGNATAGNNTFPTIAAALQAANGTGSNITYFIAAVEAAGVATSLNDTTKWTILAPTNEAVNTTLASLGLSVSTVLGPQYKPLLTSLLAYHVIPSGAYLSTNLTDGQNVTTLLPSAGNLTVRVMGSNISFVGNGTNTTVITPDIMAAQSVVHIVDHVLVPPTDTLLLEPTTAGGNMTSGGAGANNMTSMAGGAGANMTAPPAPPAGGNTTSA